MVQSRTVGNLMKTVMNINKGSFMLMAGSMSWLWQCHNSLIYTCSNKMLADFLIVFNVPMLVVFQIMDNLKTVTTKSQSSDGALIMAIICFS